MTDTYKGGCFCGEVEFEVTGTPTVMGYYHCEDCRTWSAAPVNAFSLWAPRPTGCAVLTVAISHDHGRPGHFEFHLAARYPPTRNPESGPD